ncbi:MAG: signal recognition particle protein [Anaerolineae bacterium]|nr:signal recognition particle protein [Anaerolineae bacterium]
MFESLTEKLQETFGKLQRHGVVTEADVSNAMRDVRMALLEADVNYKVVRDLVNRVRERAVGIEVTKSLSPAQQVVKIVQEELITTLGDSAPLNLGGSSPHVIMLAGLQGSGKTTTAAKLAVRLKSEGHKPLLVAADVYRPAAVQQLLVLGQGIGVPVFTGAAGEDPVKIAQGALAEARSKGNSVVILDTAGRLHIDERMMDELKAVRSVANPAEVLLIADAMTGQDAVRVAEEFNRAVPLTGLILTKVDGDARGGAAISVREVTGVPIKFLATGERTDALEPFYPERLASRILGMGDMLSLIEKAESSFDKARAAEMEQKLRNASFNLEDFQEQFRQLKQMGPLTQILEMIPGFGSVSKELAQADTDREMGRIEAIISSMTREERRNPQVINGSRKRRIAQGSGTTVQDVNALLQQFRQAQKMMKVFSRGKVRGVTSLFR